MDEMNQAEGVTAEAGGEVGDKATKRKPSVYYNSDGVEKLKRGEYMDCHECEETWKAVIWKEGDAYCPDCITRGTVYRER